MTPVRRKFRTIAFTAACLLAGAGLAMSAASSASAATASTITATTTTTGDAGATGPVPLNLGGKCLDDNGDKSADGNKVDIWTCNGSAAQKWTRYSDDTLRINGKCLDDTDTSGLVITDCDGTGVHQQWNVGTDAELVEQAGCLVDPGNSTANGTQVQVAGQCEGGPWEEWTLPAQTVHSAIAGRCLDDYQGKTANGTPVDAYSCNGRATQNWTFEPDGTVRVNGVCLDDNGNSSTAGAKVQLWACDASDAAQQWTIADSVSPFGVELRHGSLCATPTSSTAANGAQLVLGTCGSDEAYWQAW